MLDPQDRQLLLGALRPPEGFELTFAIWTTYTLDLLALLTAPLGFTLYELAGPPGAELRPDDATRLLTVLRRYADRITIFCEAGRIAVPDRRAILLGQLEGSVVEVKAPPGGSFHPKVWALRFHDAEGGVRYRVLCLTRNLTFDRSWDTITVLDGQLVDRQLGYSANKPLGDFFAALPAMAVRPDLPGDAAANTARAAEELRRVNFQCPEPFDAIAFHPVGIPGRPRFRLRSADRVLAMSPFLSAGALRDIAQQHSEAILVSRVDQLELVDHDLLANFERVLAFDPGAAIEPAASEESADDRMGTAGLHAKLYVQESGASVTVFTGSANATTAGFSRNVEFLVGLTGSRARCGIDALLGAANQGTIGLNDLLQPYVAPDDPPPIDEVEEQFEERLEEAQCAIANHGWTATISATGQAFSVLLAGRIEALDPEVTVRVRPVLLAESFGQAVDSPGDIALEFHGVAFETLTAFFAFDLSTRSDTQVKTRSFAVKALLIGEPQGRRERIAQYLLRDREQVVRFLLALLADGPDAAGGSLEIGGRSPGGQASRSRLDTSSDALLEPLLKAIDRNPDRIDEVALILEDLRQSEEGRAKLPPDLEKVWAPVWAAREALRGGKDS